MFVAGISAAGSSCRSRFCWAALDE